MNGDVPGSLPEINHSISDIEERLAAKSDELRDAKEEAERALEQLLEVQSRLEQEVLNHGDMCRGNELVLQQLHQAQEELGRIRLRQQDEQKKLRKTQLELEYYFLESRNLNAQLSRQSEKLDWLRGQRELLIRLVLVQGRKLREIMALDARVAVPALRMQGMSWWRRIILR